MHRTGWVTDVNATSSRKHVAKDRTGNF